MPVRQPLVLISQLQRAGGTLVSQLLDGHRELHVHPGELHIGHGRKYDWPVLDLSQPAAAIFDVLFERPLAEYVEFGYQKLSSAEADVDPDYRKRVLPFMFHLPLQRAIFLDQARRHPILTRRDAIDLYITSYFNAWLDYQGLYRPVGQVKYWAVFGARILSTPGQFEAFAADYPDGKSIAVLRDPVSWYASARRHSHEYENPTDAAAFWAATYRAICQNVEDKPDQVLILPFEDCVLETEAAMRRVARYLGIGFELSMLQPTFNGLPIESDSSFGSKQGIDASAVDRTAMVDEHSRRVVANATAGLYEKLRTLAGRHAKQYRDH